MIFDWKSFSEYAQRKLNEISTLNRETLLKITKYNEQLLTNDDVNLQDDIEMKDVDSNEAIVSQI